LSVSTEPTKSQRNLLATLVDVTFPSSVSTVGQALIFILKGNGYHLDPRAYKTNEHYYLYQLPLPSSHRNLGPMTLLDALQVLGGVGFEPINDPVRRSIHFKLKNEYVDNIQSIDADMAKLAWYSALTCHQVNKPLSIESDIYVVQLNDSLLDIVIQKKTETTTINQALVSFYEHNLTSFKNSNMNLLLAESILKIPTENMMLSRSNEEAKSIVWEHHNNWLNGAKVNQISGEDDE
jgi:type IV pili sensor histidine kinase/response regulator